MGPRESPGVAVKRSKTDLELLRLRHDVESRKKVSGPLLARAFVLLLNVLIGVVVWKVLEHRGESPNLEQVRRLARWAASRGVALVPSWLRLPSLPVFVSVSVSKIWKIVEITKVTQMAKMLKIPAIPTVTPTVVNFIHVHTLRVSHIVDVEVLKAAFLTSSIVGFLGTARYHHNRKVKNEKNQRLALIPGKLGTQYLLHNIPRWLSFSDVEKTEWLNRLISQAWPYYDKAICDEIRSQVEPMLDEYRPSFIKKIFFSKLTFGDSPFRIEGILVHDQDPDDPNKSIEFEVSFRWSGDANIHLAIDLQGGGVITRMVPKVTDLAVSGCARILLSPLVPEIPGFAAATVALMRPPEVKFRLDFGRAFGGSLSANAVVNWLDPFLRETMRSMLVWPRRIVVPLHEMTPEETSRLYMVSRGALEVTVKRGWDLPKADLILGQMDPKLQLFVDPLGVNERTSKKSNTLTPEWDETYWLLVQEPDDQFLHVTLLDVDTVNVMELFRMNIIKGAANILGSERPVARGKLPLGGLADSPGIKTAIELPLGDEDFSNPAGCGVGKGVIALDATYWPFEVISGHAHEPIGALLITLFKVSNAPMGDLVTRSSDVYAVFTCGPNKKTSSSVSGCDVQWENAKFEMYKVHRTSTLRVELFDADLLGWDRKLGEVKISIEDVSMAVMGDVTSSYEVTVADGLSVPNQDATTTVTLRLQFVPFKNFFEREKEQRERRKKKRTRQAKEDARARREALMRVDTFDG